MRNNKVNKGGQTTIMSDSRRFWPRAYIHLHNLHPKVAGTTKRGTNELVNLLMDIEKMVQSPDGDGERMNGSKIFRKKPTVCADNFFFDNACCEWI